MKHDSIKKVIFTSIICAVIFIGTIPALAQIPRTMSYQGVLAQSNGSTVPDGNYSLTFRLFSADSGTAALWTETQDVAVVKGIFNVILGSTNPLTLPFDRQYWLGVTIGSGSELAPRVQLTSSAYSLNAAYADSITGVAGGDLTGSFPNPTIAIGAVTSGKIAGGQVVKSINSLKDSVTLLAGNNVTITPSGDTLTISAAGGSGGGGTITGVTAGTGLTGGGTSGSVTLGAALPFSLSGSSSQAIMNSSNSGAGNGVSGQTSGASASGVYGSNTNNVSGDGVYGVSTGGVGVQGVSSSASGTGVLGNGGASSGVGVFGIGHFGVDGQSGGSGTGVYGSSLNGDGVFGINSTSGDSGIVGGAKNGVYGETSSSSNGAGVYGMDSYSGNYGDLGDANYGVFGSSGSGDGVYGSSSSSSGVYGISVAGYAVYGYNEGGGSNWGSLGGPIEGVRGQSNSGTGVVGYSTSGYGMDGGSSSSTGVNGYSTTGDGIYGSSTSGYAGYFAGNVYINGNYTATGTKNAEVKLEDGSPVLLYCEEATGVYFVDYGDGQLVDGNAHVQLDPTFLQTVTIDAQHPMMVFVQVEGDCKGVYVTNKTSTSFDVRELQGGTSQVSFSYRVVCARKYYSGLRLATPAEDNAATKTMMEKEWPEVIAKEQQMAVKMETMEAQQKAMQARMNMGPQR